MSRPIPRDCLTPVACTLAAALLLIGAFLAALRVPERPWNHPETISLGPIATTGEWVTNPDGSRVCRLRRPIYRAMVFSRDLCEDWQGAVPAWGQTVPWLQYTGAHGGKIMIEGRWRP